MTDRFIDNFTPGDGTDGLTWAKAELTAAAVDAADGVGDRWLFDRRHSESTASSVTLSVAGTAAAPSQLLSVTQSGASGISSLTAGAIVATGTGASNITLNGNFYAFGITFLCGNSSVNNVILTIGNTAGDIQVYDQCTFQIGNNQTTTTRFQIGPSTTTLATPRVTLLDCWFRPSTTGHHVCPENCNLVWRGGGLHASGSAITTFCKITDANGRTGNCLFDGLNLAAGASSMNLIDAALLNGRCKIVFHNCKLPASWSGGLFTGTLGTSVRAEMWNGSASDTNYAMWVEEYSGSIKHETTIVRTGGASDGDTPISWKMASAANAEYPTIVLRSPEIFVPNTTTGGSKTLTVEIAQDGTTTALNDDEIWLEVEYLGTSGFPLALFADDAKADVIASAAAQSDSSETWGGLSGTNKKQYLSVAVTPAEEGVYVARVCLAKASTTVYVCPKVTVS